MDFLTRMAEDKIREAIQNGELENLPGQGKPLKIEDLTFVPEELRASYIILKNSGFLPEELEVKKEILNLNMLLETCCSEEERKQIKKQLSEKMLRFNILVEKRGGKSSTLKEYYHYICGKLG
ncbi:DUF1992 domain-containing protein [Bacillota bacterium LX-D]|nr:DUF1992 domain-containing protein [Bacillota bacterium LX-D]